MNIFVSVLFHDRFKAITSALDEKCPMIKVVFRIVIKT